VPFDYCFAITMMAQPLAWFEGTGLPAEALAHAPLLRRWREHAEAIHAGTILPVGEEPCGTAWTGFQSIASPTAGYLLVLREFNERSQARLQTWFEPGTALRLTALGGAALDDTATVDALGGLQCGLPGPFSFAFYAYVSQSPAPPAPHTGLEPESPRAG
jgi:hypothetical protein